MRICVNSPYRFFVPRSHTFLKLSRDASTLAKVTESSSFSNFGMTFFGMLTVAREKFKIVWMVILRVIINVMYRFFRLQVSTNLFLHYQSMFSHIALFATKRMVAVFNVYIVVLATQNTPTLIARMVSRVSISLSQFFFLALSSFRAKFIHIYSIHWVVRNDNAVSA